MLVRSTMISLPVVSFAAMGKGMRAFIKSIVVVTLAGAFFPMIVTIIVAFTWPSESGGMLWSLLFACFPLIVVLAFVLPASLIIGLPTTAVLSRLNVESAPAYVSTGLVTGVLLPLSILYWMGAMDAWLLALIGGFSGAVTAKIWWIEAREAVLN